MYYLAILASLIYVVGYVVYNYPILKGSKDPDLVPWTIWGINGFLNAVTYRMSTNNSTMSLLNESGSVASFVTLLIAIKKGGKGRKLEPKDKLVLFLGVCCIIASRYSPILGNGFVLIASTIGMIPVWKELRVDPRRQKFLPWFIWSVALVIMLFVDLFEFEHYYELIQPSYYLTLHVVTAVKIVPKKIRS